MLHHAFEKLFSIYVLFIITLCEGITYIVLHKKKLIIHEWQSNWHYPGYSAIFMHYNYQLQYTRQNLMFLKINIIEVLDTKECNVLKLKTCHTLIESHIVGYLSTFVLIISNPFIKVQSLELMSIQYNWILVSL